MAKPTPKCNVCSEGTLKRKKKYRMSGPVVVIGYIFLIPSVLGMLFGLLMIFSTGAATSETSETMKQEIRTQLSDANVPQPIMEKVLDHETITEAEKANLEQEQRNAVESATLSYSAGTVGAGAGAAIAGGFSIFVIISSFVGGLLGWLLTMKKKVLQCVSCGAVVNAS